MVAVSIMRHFIPQYVAAWAEQSERRDKYNRELDDAWEQHYALCDVLGVAHPKREQGTPTWINVPYTATAHSYGRALLTRSGKSIDFDRLSVPLKIGLQIAALLRKD